jgi:hypothetical protein
MKRTEKKNRTQRALPLRERKEIQEMLHEEVIITTGT